MPKDMTLRTILVIGSGPIVIGQAAEFDYAGTQGCIVLKEEGYKVVLVNNNPATIMTDSTFADRIYFEPLTVDVIEKIIEKERPDGILATLGGQTGLNLAFQLNEQGILQKYGVRMLGSSVDSIKKGEDREAFRQLMKELNEPIPESVIVHTVHEAVDFAHEIGFPIIVRPAYTLGGTGGGIATCEEELIQLVTGGLQESAIGQCLVEQSIAGLKEIEYEVIRDSAKCCVTVCSMENIDPVGIHTGDSIVVAPAQTLTEEENEMLRDAAIKIVSALGIIGGCNIQFALDSKTNKYYLIEVNPRVSRSSALASKATGYPIARMAAKLAVGYTLEEISNPVTGGTFKEFEPVLDYTVVKFPRWAFDKFPAIDRKLGTQMKATGEVMAIDCHFQRALLKAIHSLEVDVSDLKLSSLTKKSSADLIEKLMEQDDERLFVVFELLRRGTSVDELHRLTQIDNYFLSHFRNLVDIERTIAKSHFDTLSKDDMQLFKEAGFSDSYLAGEWKTTEKKVRQKRKSLQVLPSFNTVDICVREREAESNYYYSSYSGESEPTPTFKKKVLVIGSGPIRIGQGIEFDYCSVHGVMALKDMGIETIMINNNPETVSTDYTIADKLYFEPLMIEDILNVMDAEEITDCLIQLGGQTAINIAKQLEEYDVNILGTTSQTIDILEDRKLFYQLLEELAIPHVKGDTVHNEDELVKMIDEIGYPVLLRPSFVIGGRGMEIIRNEKELKKYLKKELAHYPFLVDKFLHACEAEIDLVTDGEFIVAPAVMEHVEKTGVHSGDSMSLLPAQNIRESVQKKMLLYGKKISQHLRYKGLMNIQFIVDDEDVYVLEVNPRASRTIPIVSKVTGIPLVQIATKILLGKYKLSIVDEDKSLMSLPFVCMKYPVFSNYALKGLDAKLSAEMRSTGEGISIGTTVQEAIRKSFHQGKKEKGRIVVKEALVIDDLPAPFTIVESQDTSLLKEGTVAYYNPHGEEEDAKLRENATKQRIYTFTEKESVVAYCQALEIKEFTVMSIEDWHQKIRKEVATG